MHGLSSTSSAFVSTKSPAGLKGTDKNLLTQNGQRFRVQPTAAMIGGHEAEIFGFAKDIATAAATGATGDLIAQLAAKKRKESAFQLQDGNEMLSAPFEMDLSDLDLRRTAAYGCFAAGYTGAFQHVLFDNLQERISDPVERLAINQGLIIPLVYYSLLVWLVPKLRARSPEEEVELRGNINVQKMIPRNWAFWVPLQFIQFNFIPTDFQVIYCSLLGLIWNICLSFMTAGGQQPTVPQPTMADLNLEPNTASSEGRISSTEPELDEAFESVGSSSSSSFSFFGPSNSTSFAGSSKTVLAAMDDGLRRR